MKSLRFYAQTDAFSEFQLYDLEEGLKHIEDLLSYRMGQRVKVKYHVKDTLPPVYVDAGKINDVLMNLFMNALDAIDENSNIEEGIIDITLEKENNHIRLMIKDNGVGMSPEVQNQIFNPFLPQRQLEVIRAWV